MDRARFYAALRHRDSGVFGTSLTQAQVDRLEAILTRLDAKRIELAQAAEKMKALERENRELRQANEILRKASAYFAMAELDRRSK